MNASAGMIRKLAQISAIGLQDELPRRLGEADLDSLENSHRAWLDTIPAADKLNGKTAEDAEDIVKGIQSAMLSMTEFDRKPSRYHLWNVQSSVMASLLADRHMRSLFQAAIWDRNGSSFVLGTLERGSLQPWGCLCFTRCVTCPRNV